MPKTICNFTSDNRQFLDLTVEVQNALLPPDPEHPELPPDQGIVETRIARLAPHAQELADAYREHLIGKRDEHGNVVAVGIRSSASANQSHGDVLARELDALDELLKVDSLESLRAAAGKMMAISSRTIYGVLAYDPRRR